MPHTYAPKDESEEKLARIKKLFEYHRTLGGSKAGKRKADFQILNESAIVLLYAAWENYLEYECVFRASHIVVAFDTPASLPNSIKSFVAGGLGEIKKPADFWLLAGKQWKRELQVRVAKEVFENHQGSTSRANELFHRTLGLRGISKQWTWKAMSSSRAEAKLTKYIALRGSIAHTAGAPTTVTLDQCEEFATHLESLVKRTSELLDTHLQETLGIVCDAQIDEAVSALSNATYVDIEAWQKSTSSDVVTTTLQGRNLI